MQTQQFSAVPENIREQIVAQLGIQNAPKEKQDEVFAKIGEVAFQKLLLAVLDRLGEKEQEAFGDLLERQASPEEVQKFLQEHIADYEEMCGNIVKELMASLMR